MEASYTLFTFASTHEAMAAEKLLKALSPYIVPVLREISAGCGIAIRVKPEDTETAVSLLSPLAGWKGYHVVHQGRQPICTLLAEGTGKAPSSQNG